MLRFLHRKQGLSFLASLIRVKVKIDLELSLFLDAS